MMMVFLQRRVLEKPLNNPAIMLTFIFVNLQFFLYKKNHAIFFNFPKEI